MSQIDFIVGFVLIISTIFLIVYFISNYISNDVSTFNVNELQKSSSSLKRHLFDINDDKSLVSSTRELQAVLIETNGTAHTEEIRISIQPQVNKVHVYDTFMTEISSTSSQLPGETILSFQQDFDAYEEKRINIFYFGDAVNNINYLSTENNISLIILSDKELNVVSQEKCSNFQGKSYEETKKIFGFQHQFRIDLNGCDYGSQPPLTANVIVNRIPVLFESSNELLSAEFANLRVWQ
jgi:uncharacterized protein YbcI